MSELTIEERVARLERSLMSVFALITGEAQREGTAEEIEALTTQLGEDFEAMKQDL
jgi:hypothetical protein